MNYPLHRANDRGFSSVNVMEDDQEEISLYESSREREMLDEQANLFAIIVATEHLERAYARDAISQQEYTTQCKKLISQFKLAERVLMRSGGGGSAATAAGGGMSTEAFMELYQLDCPRAAERLLRMGVPEPIKGGMMDSASHAVTVAETVQHFITAMDAVKLEQRAVDELQPLLSDLMDVLTRVPDTPNDFEPNRKVQKWLQKLNSMRAVEEIGEDDSRQLYMDLDSAYTEFNRFLKRGA
jgi:ESCRT-I complex subunit VPS28